MSSFEVRRGDFTVPAELLEDGREWELSRLFAQQLPPGCTSITRRMVRGVTTVHWVRVRFLGWYDEDGHGPLLGEHIDEAPALAADDGREALGIARL